MMKQELEPEHRGEENETNGLLDVSLLMFHPDVRLCAAPCMKRHSQIVNFWAEIYRSYQFWSQTTQKVHAISK
jgi:hypothetical protein